VGWRDGQDQSRSRGARLLRAAWPWLWQWGLAIGLIALVLPQLHGLRLPERSDIKHPVWLAVALAAEIVSTLAAVVLQWISVASARRPPGWRRVGLITLAATAIGYLVPGGPAVATVYSARRYRDNGVGQETAAGGQLLLGFVTALAIGALGLIGISLSSPADFVDTLSDTAWAAVGWVAGVMVVASAAGLVALRLPRPRRWLQTSRLVRWVVGTAADIQPAEAGSDLRLAPGATRFALGGLAAEAVVLGADLGCLRCVLAAIGVHVDIGVLITAYAVAMVVSMLPITPGGLGVVEGSLAALLVAQGSADDLLTTSVVGYRLISYWLVVVVGLVALIIERVSYTRARRRRVAARSARSPVEVPIPSEV
jgi:uncharacterized membrane protein YbhN (UPF0104 family)